MKREALLARKAEIAKRMKEIVDGAERETRDLTDDENTEIRTLISDNDSVTEKLAELDAADEQRAKAAAIVSAVIPAPAHTEERTAPYAKGGPDSYFRDMFRSQIRGDRQATERLVRNDRYTADKGNAEQRAMSTAAGAGGEFAPPLWQIEDFVGYLRPGRPTANLLNHAELPAGVSSINLPKVTLGALTGTQGTQNTAVADRDFATGSVSTGISTIAGQVVISQQDLDQSPINMDEVVLADMAADYALQIDLAVIAALVAAAGNTVTYTDTTPTSGKVLNYVQQAIDAVALGVYRPATAIVMRPDRWGRFVSFNDGQGRPLVVPNAAYGPWNAAGLADPSVVQGVAGSLRGVATVLDASVPNNLGAGTNQDEILVFRPEESWLYESTPKAEVFQQTYANQLSVLCRFYAYYGIIANRLPKSISLVTGTGLIPPAYGA